jgi:hypothetical protein
MKKNSGKKSRATVPLTVPFDIFKGLLCTIFACFTLPIYPYSNCSSHSCFVFFEAKHYTVMPSVEKSLIHTFLCL